ncbi:MAG: M64 family metallopeptidase [Planctomycetota bacterium]
MILNLSWVLLLLLLQDNESGPGVELWQMAQKAADSGRYSAADALYRRIVEEAPGTELARAAKERLQPNALLRVVDLEMNGDPERRIDVFIMGEGYSRKPKSQKIFDKAAMQTVTYFSQAPVFRRYQKFFNFHAMNIASREDGVDRAGHDYDTPLGAFESGATQGQVAVDPESVWKFLRMDPRAEGFAVVIVRLGTLGTGGGGIAVVGGAPSNVVIHEWGHAFGDLGDEYTSDVGYTGPTPRNVNVSDSPDPEKAPWKHWLDLKTKGVGVFAGAAGRSQGAWRPTASGCAMSRGPSFCLVCREALVAHIYDLISPIDEVEPSGETVVIDPSESSVFRVIPMAVIGEPSLEVRFTLEEVQGGLGTLDLNGGGGNGFFDGPEGGGLFSEDRGEPAVVGGGGGYHSWNRRSRFGKQPDPPLKGEDLRVSRQKMPDRRVAYEVKLSARELGPGSYRLHARVADPTDWVLSPEWLPLLSETRTWKIVVR